MPVLEFLDVRLKDLETLVAGCAGWGGLVHRIQ
jgi:hypothetical protein